ncbi:MAG: 16S rRNA (guanine(966)-N(2))-methyltransferase RsmD [Parvularculaceae bacterium]|nr:16S rRNA (guanine(966)-N(2))-methyltransferase RsmD [Parvularculaceae bacterium]
MAGTRTSKRAPPRWTPPARGASRPCRRRSQKSARRTRFCGLTTRRSKKPPASRIFPARTRSPRFAAARTCFDMRIVGGAFRGRTIAAPKGSSTRPTADGAREALFNVLAHRDDFSFEGARVIDLFAGSGALGLEAMSRGAAWCLFVETDAAARGAIRDNVETLGLFGATRIHRRSATSLGDKPAGVGAPFTLAFLDPPYAMDLCAPCLDVLRAGRWLADAALVVVEQGEREAPAEAQGFVEEDRRRWGAAQVGIYRFGG